MKLISRINKKISIYFYNKYYKKNDLKHNLVILRKLKLKKTKIIKILKKENYDFFDANLSWHYHIFSGLSNPQKKKIVEIGTHSGEFTNFVSKIFKEASIYTFDLPLKDPSFTKSYSRNNIKSYKDSYFLLRRRNLKNRNIFLIENDSINICNYFKHSSIDIFWVDGDHKNPQVSLDIYNAINLTKKNGYILIDDIIMDNKQTINSNKDSYNFIKACEKKNLIKPYFFIKRIKFENIYIKKYICFCIKI